MATLPLQTFPKPQGGLRLPGAPAATDEPKPTFPKPPAVGTAAPQPTAPAPTGAPGTSQATSGVPVPTGAPAPAPTAFTPPASKAAVAAAKARIAEARAATAKAQADAAQLTETAPPAPVTPPTGEFNPQQGAGTTATVATPEPPATSATSAAPTGGARTDLVGKQLGAPADAAPPPDPFQPLIDAATKALTATEDPLAKVKYNQAIQDIGLKNQAATDALKMRIAADPSLAGQGAGSAMMSLMASQMNMNVDQLIGQLTVDSIQRVIDLNKWGFDNLQQAVEARATYQRQVRNDLLDAGDIDGWADLMEQQTGVEVDREALKASSPTTLKLIDTLSLGIQNNLRSGNEARARELFEQLKAAAPGQFGTLTFEDFISKADTWTANSAAKQETLTAIRERIAAGDLEMAISGLQSLYPEDVSAEKGRKLLTDGMELAEVNRLLTEAGYDEVASLDDMIGMEDELYLSSELDKIKGGLDAANVFDQMVLSESQELASYLGVEALTPEMQQGLREFLYQQRVTGGIVLGEDGNFHFSEGATTPPWLDPKSGTSIYYQAWPLPGQNTFSADFPDEGSALEQRNKELDDAYTAYVAANPDAAQRMTREQWYQSVVKASGDDTGTPAPNESNYASITEWNRAKADAALTAWQAAGGGTAGNTAAANANKKFEEENPKPGSAGGFNFDVTTTGPEITPSKYLGKDYVEIDSLIKGEGSATSIPWTSKEVTEWVNKQPNIVPAGIGNATQFADANKGQWVKIDGQMYRVDSGDQRRYKKDSKIGKDSFSHRDIMELTKTDGTKIWMSSDGKTSTTPPPPTREAFIGWYDAMEAA